MMGLKEMEEHDEPMHSALLMQEKRPKSATCDWCGVTAQNNGQKFAGFQKPHSRLRSTSRRAPL